MKLSLLTVSAFVGTSVAWEIDPRCPGYMRQRRLQEKMDLFGDKDIVGPDSRMVNQLPVTENTHGLVNHVTRNLRGAEGEHTHRDLVSSFQLKMYWQQGYCWQDEWIERKWCISCQGRSCESGEPLWVQFCNAADKSQQFNYIPVAGTGGGQLMTASTNLCLERVIGNNTFVLAGCKIMDMDKQIFVGIKTDGSRFELSTKGSIGKCLVNYWHHPKAGELIFADTCDTARHVHTNEWTTYNGGSESNPFTASDLTSVKIHTNKCSSSRPCGLCEGDCDSDNQCTSGMKCFQRNGVESVPGCYGAGTIGSDVCYQPSSPITNITSGAASLKLRNPECSISQRCGICEGDCDSDDECMVGMKCFQRSSLELVPGCSGAGIATRDYCYQPTGSGSINTTVATPLKLRNPECSISQRCGICEGDCDSDDECMVGMKCFQRSGLELVPGCSGAGIATRDYCYQPTSTVLPGRINTTVATPLKLRNPECSISQRCGICEGDCDSDDECMVGMKCFQRSGLELVPGCSGAGTSGRDYCYQASLSPIKIFNAVSVNGTIN